MTLVGKELIPLFFISDEDECVRLKPCSDFCHNSPGSFACSCPFGYTLDIDGRNCLGEWNSFYSYCYNNVISFLILHCLKIYH